MAKQPSIPEKWVSTWLYRTPYPPFILLNAWDLGWKACGPVTTWSSSCDLRKAIPEGVAQSIVSPDWGVQAAPLSDPELPGEKGCRDVSRCQAVTGCPTRASDNSWQQWRLMSHQRGFQSILIPRTAWLLICISTPLFWAGLSQSWCFLQCVLSTQSLLRSLLPDLASPACRVTLATQPIHNVREMWDSHQGFLNHFLIQFAQILIN